MPVRRASGDVAGEIGGLGLPTLFIDTCAALDVVRCATRASPRVATIARAVIDAKTAGELLVYASSIVTDEAARNRVEVEGQARREARRFDDVVAGHVRIAGAVGHGYPHVTPFSHEGLVGPLLALHDELLDTCVHLTNDPTLAPVVLMRAGIRRRPARGGGGVNDCLMFEEFRHVARAVPRAEPLILLTTNTSDFGEQGRVHSEIADDLAGTKARVCLSWPEAAAAVLGEARLRRT